MRAPPQRRAGPGIERSEDTTTRPGQQKNIPAMGRTAGFGRVRRAVRRRAKAVVLMPVLFAAATAAIVFLLPDRYEALVTLQVDPQPATVNSMTGETDDKAQQRALDEEIDVPAVRPVGDAVVLECGSDPEPWIGPDPFLLW